MENKVDLDLNTLEYIKFSFDLYSDMSSQTLGYKYLCGLIEKEKINNIPLNKEDIESLGWKHRGQFIFEKTQIEDDKELHTYTLHLNEDEHKIYISNSYDYFENTISILIKNKSELSILMKQLGIS